MKINESLFAKNVIISLGNKEGNCNTTINKKDDYTKNTVSYF